MASNASRRLEITIGGDATGAVKAAKDTEAAYGRLGATTQAQTASITKNLVGLGVAYVGVRGAFSAADAASSLDESLSKSNQVFAENAKVIENWSKDSAENLGISQQAAIEAAATYGNLFAAMKIAPDVSAKMSTSLVGLASDLASFNNADPTDVLEALRSGLTGEVEPLRKFGINLNDARLRQEALKLGLSDGKSVLDASAKAQAAYSIILQDSALAQGDFARTSDGLANKQRIANAEFQNAKAALGAALVPGLKVAADAAGFLTGKLVDLPPTLQSAAVFGTAGGLVWLKYGDSLAAMAGKAGTAVKALSLAESQATVTSGLMGGALRAIPWVAAAYGADLLMERLSDNKREASEYAKELVKGDGPVDALKQLQQATRDLTNEANKGSLTGFSVDKGLSIEYTNSAREAADQARATAKDAKALREEILKTGTAAEIAKAQQEGLFGDTKADGFSKSLRDQTDIVTGDAVPAWQILAAKVRATNDARSASTGIKAEEEIAANAKVAAEAYKDYTDALEAAKKATEDQFHATIEAVTGAQGVKDALSGASDAIDDYNTAAAGGVINTDELTSAQEGLTSAQESYQSSLESVAKAVEDEQKAERDAIDARVDARQAQDDLNKARIDAVDYLRDLALAERAAGDAVAGAELDVERAKDDLRKARSNKKNGGLTEAEAAQKVREAETALAEARQKASEASKANNEAQKAGVEGTPDVVAAKKALAEANDRVRDADQRVVESQKAVQRASADTVKSHDAVNRAAKELAKAEEQASKDRVEAAGKATEAIEGSVQAFVDQQVAQREAAGETVTAKDKMDLYRFGLSLLNGQIKPGSELRKNIDDLLARLLLIEASYPGTNQNAPNERSNGSENRPRGNQPPPTQPPPAKKPTGGTAHPRDTAEPGDGVHVAGGDQGNLRAQPSYRPRGPFGTERTQPIQFNYNPTYKVGGGVTEVEFRKVHRIADSQARSVLNELGRMVTGG